ncbi:SbcC/MukB-like Walker B domain-containing protein [Anoxybacillus rupiensis]|uniref:SbcC/MukB-like Walker B domain-containing protein n=1 Tax=Anoxybacteroides rupiense TaxID=311460 RepID=A0ABT5W9U0_9BACL|nr:MULTISPECIES: SbcC/MukB-like Walker B domain-containing protein [Anoxybacillus]MDE8565584.1 SbcC/MukB-like Walker B domain-containing protein [Anoxybacillus rupiensis]QHC03334.1 AAA family ATPase [Anoxybacillus sp. PDR2]
MKWMKRLRLINWHYFTDETMEFGKQTLITGQNAAGKSTIIDALQVLLIADQRQIRFNPAAHEEAKRSMINYLKGKIGSDDRTFVRDGDFTTYIAAEYYDEAKEESFVVGVVIDVFRDQQFEEEYFILADCRLDDVEFVKPSGHLRNRSEFKDRHNGTSLGTPKRARTIFERNKSLYQKALLQRFGSLHERFFSIFLKALSFKPIHSVRDFVYDYILDRRELQLELMKQNFDIHERYKLELEQLQVRKDKLLAIRNQYEQYDKLRVTTREQDYVIRRLKLTLERENLEAEQREQTILEDALRKLEGEIELVAMKHEQAKTEVEQALTRWKSHDSVKRQEELKSKIDQLSEQADKLQRELAFTKRSLEAERLVVEQLADWSGNGQWTWERSVLEQLHQGLEQLSIAISSLERRELPDGIQEQLGQLGARLNEIYEQMVIERSRTDEHIKTVTAQIAELEQVIRDLENQKRTYPASVNALKSLLEERLGDRSPVWIFCEEMEVEDEAWRNALEGYLNTQRFDLLVRPDVFTKALEIYEQEKFTLQLEGVGLVDTEKEQRYLNSSQAGSLAHVLKTDNPIIRAHLEHLLGRVMKADNEQELRKHRTAVTRTCMVYNNLVARQMKRSQYELPYIGTKAIARQLELKKHELAAVRLELTRLRRIHKDFEDWTEKLGEKRARLERLGEQLALLPQLAEVRSELEIKQRELASLDLSEAIRLEEEYRYWRDQETKWDKRRTALSIDKAKKEVEQQQVVTRIYIQKNKVRDAEYALESWSAENDPGLLQGALARWADAEKQDIPTQRKIENWQSNLNGNMTRRDNAFHALQRLRLQFNTEHLFDGSETAEDNEIYDAALQMVADLNIPEYQQKVEKALQDSEEEFKSHFVFKLREAIAMARREFHELNHALRHFPFSQDRYHFEVSPSEKYRKFYEAIMNPLLGEKGSLFDLPDNDSAETLHQLFEMLVRGEAGDLEEFTDYRRYLDFDIKVHSRDTSYSFSKVLKEKSGGETQTPFYIAILASFYHLYKSNKTVRLVVFDEAFNKMDEQRIQSSLRLIKQLNLQLIAAVPDEKMQHMAPEVTTTLIVTNQNYRCFVDMLDRRELQESDATDDAVLQSQDEDDQEQEKSVQQGELF